MGLLTSEEYEELVALRRHLHANPELSFEEYETAAYIRAQLARVGVEDVEVVADTGVVANIKGVHPGPTLAFRGDIDALPIQEADTRAYRSQKDGVMHACGHDVHTTLGLGIARALVARRDEIHGTVRCIFQPAEEASPQDAPIGAERMAVEGALEGVDAIFAFHCMPTLEVGKIGYTGGPVWASSDLVEITIHGQKTHGAYPHSGIDAVVVASHVVVALQTIVGRRVDARQACVLTIGKMTSGESYNILAERAELTGILRTLSQEAASVALEELHRIVEGVCAAHGARGEVKVTPGARLVENAGWLEERTVRLLREVAGEEALVPHLPQLGAEDFASFSMRVPACYLFLGVRNQARGIVHMLHTSEFDVDEACLDLGVGAMSQAILKLGQTW